MGSLYLHHVACHLCAVEECVIVDLCYKVEGFQTEAFKVSGPCHAGVADKGVNGAECYQSLVYQFFDAVYLAYVRLYENGLVVARDGVEGVCRGLSCDFVEVGDNDIGPFLHQLARNSLAEALGGARHYYRLSFDSAVG